ncbi:hypothetical protein HPP92_013554 [Vanilla planifolia]|uniref:DUF7477 domain-containing protein n=1 Tax=Vanilla planifolia TaxID=51239 RepID=A0A835QSH1_VANPL|nr:hypothetical protein HPP92_013554 [Vanilla planifolia]
MPNASDNDITGELPLCLAEFTNLEILSLRGNSIGGLIPASLSTLQNLFLLDLPSNQLTGEIPSELGNLTYSELECSAITLSENEWIAFIICVLIQPTSDQAAFILSIPKRKVLDETQETLRTSAFPSNHVKEKWAKNL